MIGDSIHEGRTDKELVMREGKEEGRQTGERKWGWFVSTVKGREKEP